MALKVKHVDPLNKRNAEAHRTSEFEVRDRTLFLRRGQAFDVVLQVDRPYEDQRDSIVLIFEFAPRASTAAEALGKSPPSEELDEDKFKVFSPEVSVRGVLGSVTVTPDATTKAFMSARLCNDTWDAVVAEFKENELRVQVMVPASAQVGYWKMTIETARTGLDGKNGLVCPYALLLLFNPWCPEDLVYTADKDIRKAYVQRQTIRVCYRGGTDMWDAAPFAADTVQCVLQLLGTIARLRPLERANPILVARALCRGINSDGVDGVDDNGLLVGNWEDYEDGTAPWDWKGSRQIFEEYLKGKTSVKYGQCYTFASLMVSACRALGIPCRSVTAYSPGVDTDASLTLDITNEDEPKMKRDFDWYFHVWNEVWMARPDLPDGYGGWQALDSCPIRAFRTGVLTNIGPVPVKAIKEGHVGIAYDAHVMFSAVNADVLNFRDGKLYNISTDEIGNQVLTEKVPENEPNITELNNLLDMEDGEDGTEDITSLYKYPEGSAEERAAVRRAMCHVQYVYGELEDGVVIRRAPPTTFELKAKAGSDGPSFVRFDNLSSEQRLVKFEVEAIQQAEDNEDENTIRIFYQPAMQNGVREQKIHLYKGQVTVEPHKII